MTIKSFDPSFTPAERAMVTTADLDATALMAQVAAGLRAFDLKQYITNAEYVDDPHDVAFAKAMLGTIGDDLGRIMFTLSSGIDAHIDKTACTHHLIDWITGSGPFSTPIYAYARHGIDAITFASVFLDPTTSNSERAVTIVHELIHITLDTTDEDIQDVYDRAGAAISILQRDTIVQSFVTTAYWWETIDNGPPSAMINSNLLQHIFRRAGAPVLPLESPRSGFISPPM